MDRLKKKTIYIALVTGILLTLAIFFGAALLLGIIETTDNPIDQESVEEAVIITDDGAIPVERPGLGLNQATLQINTRTITQSEPYLVTIEYPTVVIESGGREISPLLDRQVRAINSEIAQFIANQKQQFSQTVEQFASAAVGARPSELTVTVDDSSITSELLVVTFAVEEYVAGSRSSEITTEILTISLD